MSPGGHLLTTALACAGSAALMQSVPLAESLPLTAGIALGGFFIDVDHFADYVLVEGQRDLRPAVFLRYYLEGRARRVVLALHSYELFAVLGAIAWWLDAVPLWGYLMGALMHLALDVLFNGESMPCSIAAFYSVGYRLVHRFDSAVLLGRRRDLVASPPFWTAFFAGARLGERAPTLRGIPRGASTEGV